MVWNMKRHSSALIFIALVVGISYSVYILYQTTSPYAVDSDISDIPSLSKQGFTEVGVDADSMLHFYSGCKRLDMVVSESQLISIKAGLEGYIGPRPLTHDLMNDMIEGLDTEILMIKIDDFSDGTYYAKIIVKQGNRILSLDARPSDATAIAVRASVPIYMSQELLDTHGTDVC